MWTDSTDQIWSSRCEGVRGNVNSWSIVGKRASLFLKVVFFSESNIASLWIDLLWIISGFGAELLHTLSTESNLSKLSSPNPSRSSGPSVFFCHHDFNILPSGVVSLSIDYCIYPAMLVIISHCSVFYRVCSVDPPYLSICTQCAVHRNNRQPAFLTKWVDWGLDVTQYLYCGFHVFRISICFWVRCGVWGSVSRWSTASLLLRRFVWCCSHRSLNVLYIKARVTSKFTI